MDKFQSTHPSWGATEEAEQWLNTEEISIHAPIVGCDMKDIYNGMVYVNFNPRTHRGVRLLLR